MKKYEVDGCQVYRDDINIIIETQDGKKEIFELEEEPLHIGKINIPLSNSCSMKCLYCSESEYNVKSSISISKNVAFQIIDEYIMWISKYPAITELRLSFDYGGEPVCHLDLLEKISSYFRHKCIEKKLKSIVMMTTNCAWNSTLLTRVLASVDEIIVSIDGPKEIHEKYRIYKGENSVFELIIKNALSIYETGKLKQISSVITKDTIERPEEYVNYFINMFPNCSIKVAAVIVTGDAKNNNIARIQLNEWNEFIERIKEIAKGKIIIIDSKPEKKLEYKYTYGCEHMRMSNWFCWLDGNISCCTDRENSNYYIGHVNFETLKMDYSCMSKLEKENNVENIEICSVCIAKYYCSGGCPEFRKEKMNCERRIEKYAKMFTKKIREKG